MSSRDLDSEIAAPATPDVAPAGGVLSAPFRWTSIGMCLLITLAAFEALAVTTIMPTVSRELDGASLYAFAFAGPLAVGVVGMVAAGAWTDRGNPRSALIASVVLFAAGLLTAGLAPTMGVFVTGRLVHGLGGGALTVVLYVIVARVYPPRLHPRIFAGFAAAWVIPSLIGPFIAGVLSETVGWRWVFLGVVALTALAMLMVVPVMRGVRRAPDEPGSFPVGRILWSLLLAVAVLALTLGAEASGPIQWIVPVLAVAVAAVAIRPLVPRGTLVARRGLPSVILMRAIVAATFFASEVYVPLMMVTEYGLSAAIAGLALTAAGLSWSAASWAQGRFPGIGNRLAARLGATGLTIALASLIATAAWHLDPWVVVVGWAFAGAGMGFVYPRLGVLTLHYSTTADQGFNSSALTIADSTGSAVALAATAVVFAALRGLAGGVPFVGAFAVTAVLCGLAWVVGSRLVRR
ncbi:MULTISPECIES: MFS transporter [unclassified Leifsonia]|uniref:MFS transporter n=1 Tax=unclassified Leifsonia TaxID=2663824 RepID=UPI00036069A9|nr:MULTISPECIES: MFS transporter [unclassified Leifsonia]TDQ02637.1 putative MFS family arabinose efflux permease [Leifsonia sp. 115AMFTsu3.1]